MMIPSELKKFRVPALDFFAFVRENRIAMLEKKGGVITMGTIVDEIERNAIIELVKKSSRNGRSKDYIINIIVDGLGVSEEEAEKIYESEIEELLMV